MFSRSGTVSSSMSMSLVSLVSISCECDHQSFLYKLNGVRTTAETNQRSMFDPATLASTRSQLVDVVESVGSLA